MKGFKLELNKNLLIIKEKKVYKSCIQDLQGNYIFIDIPVNKGSYLPLREEEEIECEYYSDNGIYYIFSTKVISRVLEGNLRLLKLSKPYSLQKIQRRNFVRVPLVEYAFYKIHENDKWNKGMILDLSGGGLRVKINEELNLNDKIVINIPIGVEEKVSVVGKITRVEPYYGEYIYGLNFIDLEERVRDKIIQKVFEEMRRQRVLT